MATIWFLEEGEIQRGPHAGQKPIDWCVSHLGLRLESWIAPLERKDLTVGQKDPKRGPYRDMRFVIAEITPDDLHGKFTGEWEPGFYLLDMSVREARAILERES